MTTSAIVMMIVAMGIIWGGLLLSIWAMRTKKTDAKSLEQEGNAKNTA